MGSMAPCWPRFPVGGRYEGQTETCFRWFPTGGGHPIIYFNGFSSRHADFISIKDHDKLAGLLKQHFAITLEASDISVKGWNWGVTDFRGMVNQ